MITLNASVKMFYQLVLLSTENLENGQDGVGVVGQRREQPREVVVGRSAANRHQGPEEVNGLKSGNSPGQDFFQLCREDLLGVLDLQKLSKKVHLS